MTASLTQPPPAERDFNEVSPASIAIWLALLLLTIVLVVARTKFWIRGGDDADALRVMLVAQLAGASIFAPILLRNLRTSVCVVLSALPFLHVAAIISSAETAVLVRAACAAVLWLSSLALAMSISRSTLLRGIMHALVNCIAIGGVIAFYLQAEFADPSSAIEFASCGPIGAALTLLRRGSSSATLARAWITLCLLALIFSTMASVIRVFLVARAPRD